MIIKVLKAETIVTIQNRNKRCIYMHPKLLNLKENNPIPEMYIPLDGLFAIKFSFPIYI
jgi:hypothetical protein